MKFSIYVVLLIVISVYSWCLFLVQCIWHFSQLFRSTLIDIKNEINKFNKQLCRFISHLVTANIKLRQRFHIFIEVCTLSDTVYLLGINCIHVHCIYHLCTVGINCIQHQYPLSCCIWFTCREVQVYLCIVWHLKS